MVDRPTPKKPVQRLEPIAQLADSESNQDKPITTKEGENWRIDVFLHPVVKSRYSYKLTINNRVRLHPSPISDDQPYLFGCFSSPQEALSAGLEEVEI
jgi:hypothetical protein